MKKREDKWDNHVVPLIQIEKQKKMEERDGKTSTAPEPETTSRPETANSAIRNLSTPVYSASRKTNSKIRHRCENKSSSEEDLIFQGQYRFNDEQEKIYQDFVEMLSDFDPHDMVRIHLFASGLPELSAMFPFHLSGKNS